MMPPEMMNYRISCLQRDLEATWQKYRKIQAELHDLLQAQAAVTESTTKGQLLTESSSSGHVRYRDQE